MKENYLRIQKEIQKDLEEWNKLQLSLMERISKIKNDGITKIIILISKLNNPINL